MVQGINDDYQHNHPDCDYDYNPVPPMLPHPVGPIIPGSCGCGNKEPYIDKWFLYFSTNASFKAHIDKNFIHPDSICFLEETGQLFTNGHFFGVCKEDFENLKNVVFNHTKMIKNILGIDGPSVADGVINNLRDITAFLSGYTTEEGTLREIINKIQIALEASIEDVKTDLQFKYTELTQKFDNLALQCEREHNIINSRITTNASDITLLKSRVTAVEDELIIFSLEVYPRTYSIIKFILNSCYS